MNTYKIVLTGGPCGGKTDSIKFLTQSLTEQGDSVKVVDETATSLLNLGYMPNSNISTFDFQNLLFKIQFLNEYISEGKSSILLCDRGLFDGKVYIGKDDFQKILMINKVDENILFKTYDGALYFKSIAYDFPERFALKRSFETPEIGRLRDELCKKIWLEKIIPCDYNNLDGFNNKQRMIYSSLKRHLNLLRQISSCKLTDYYDYEHFQYVYNGIDNILDNNDISKDVKIKTKDLIQW